MCAAKEGLYPPHILTPMWQLLKEDITCVFERDPAARSVFDVLTCYSGVHAILFHRFNHAMWKRGLRWPARFLANVARWLTGIEIHPGAKIGRRFFVDHGTGVVVGETAEIGDDVTLYQGVTLGGRTLDSGKRHPTLEAGVVVGAGAKILGPFTVGAGARVGSNAVVLEPVPAYSTVVGVPARVVRCRDKDQNCLDLMTGAPIETPPEPFAAYGVDGSEDIDEPLASDVAQLSREVSQLRAEIKALRAAANPTDRTGTDDL